MPVLTQSGRIALAKAMSEQVLHLAWGTGDGAWTTNVPAESTSAVALLNELGRRTVSEVAFVVPDAGGDITVPGGVFSRSVTPTNRLYVRTTFDYADESSAQIRECAIYADSVPIEGLPVGQKYFTPAQIEDEGRIVHLENFQPIYRSPAIRESFETVIVF